MVVTGDRSTSASIAPDSPLSVRMAGWMPRASSRSSTRASFASLLADSRSESSSGSVAGHPEGQAERDESLLGAVVQVTFQPASGGVGCFNDPRAGAADLVELIFDLGSQPGMFQRLRCSGGSDPDQVGFMA